MNEAHIYIYGIIDYFQDEKAAEYGHVNLTSIKNQLEPNKDAETIIVHIHSDGGDVDEGYAIHDFLKAQGKKVITINEGSAHSIASVIFMAGSERRIAPNASMLIHLPSGGVFGTSEQIAEYNDYIQKIKTRVVSFYSSMTTLSEEEVLDYMKAEKELNADEAISFGFATEKTAQMRAVAKYTKREKVMSEVALTKDEFEKKINPIQKAINKILGIKDEKVKNLAIQDANGVEIDFYDKTEGDPTVGDKANVDGSPAEGEYTMTDGSKVTFDKGVVTEIVPAESEEDEDMVALKAENAELKQKLEAKEDKVTNLTTEKEKVKTQMLAINAEIKNLKKSLNSNFKIEDDPENKKPGEKGGETKRTLFK